MQSLACMRAARYACMPLTATSAAHAACSVRPAGGRSRVGPSHSGCAAGAAGIPRATAANGDAVGAPRCLRPAEWDQLACINTANPRRTTTTPAGAGLPSLRWVDARDHQRGAQCCQNDLIIMVGCSGANSTCAPPLPYCRVALSLCMVLSLFLALCNTNKFIAKIVHTAGGILRWGPTLESGRQRGDANRDSGNRTMSRAWNSKGRAR
jgi:hypothetical protein